MERQEQSVDSHLGMGTDCTGCIGAFFQDVLFWIDFAVIHQERILRVARPDGSRNYPVARNLAFVDI